jgi:hypothetical protein
VVALVGAATAWRLLPSGRGIAADEGPGVDARDPAHQAAA